MSVFWFVKIIKKNLKIKKKHWKVFSAKKLHYAGGSKYAEIILAKAELFIENQIEKIRSVWLEN